VDPLGLKPPRDIPPGVDMCANAQIAKQLPLYSFTSNKSFYDYVKTGGLWDYKQIHPKYQDFGNYHFGY